MYYKSIEHTLKNGKTVAIRSIRPEEGEALSAFLTKVYGQTRFMLRTSEDPVLSAEKATALLDQIQANNTGVYLGAYVEGRLCGIASLYVAGENLHRVAHRCCLGMACDEAVWGQGIGSRLMEAMIDVAQRVGYEQMELEVLTDNDAAFHLYEKFGFKVFGTRPHAMKDSDGTYHDEHLMVKQLTAKFEAEEKSTTDLEEWIEEQGIQLRY